MYQKLTENYSLKIAGPNEDIDTIYNLVKRAIVETPYKDLLLSDKEGKEGVELFLNMDQNSFVTILLQYKDEPVGILAANKINNFPFAYTMATELLWWVEPEHRKGIIPFKMVEAYEYWAKLVGCSYVCLSFVDKFKTRNRTKLKNYYKKNLGYRLFEESYMKELK